MKLFRILLCVAAVASSRNLAQQPGDSSATVVKQLLAATEQQMAEILPDAPEAVAEKPALLQRIPEFRILEKDLDSSWRSAISNLATVAPTQTSQVILVQACARMAPMNYIKFLNEMALACEQKRISKALLQRAMSPDGRLEYILEDNYQNKDVIAFCQSAKRIWAADPQMVNMFNVILSGEAKRGIDDMRKGGGETAPEVKIEPSASPTSGR
jgi:endonuclease/exonuclease/phosphatase (EEP) superfamily protein YafD